MIHSENLKKWSSQYETFWILEIIEHYQNFLKKGNYQKLIDFKEDNRLSIPDILSLSNNWNKNWDQFWILIIPSPISNSYLDLQGIIRQTAEAFLILRLTLNSVQLNSVNYPYKIHFFYDQKSKNITISPEKNQIKLSQNEIKLMYDILSRGEDLKCFGKKYTQLFNKLKPIMQNKDSYYMGKIHINTFKRLDKRIKRRLKVF